MCWASSASCSPADFPYEDDAEAVRFMDGAKVTEDERKQIYETNAVRIFKLKA